MEIKAEMVVIGIGTVFGRDGENARDDPRGDVAQILPGIDQYKSRGRRLIQ